MIKFGQALQHLHTVFYNHLHPILKDQILPWLNTIMGHFNKNDGDNQGNSTSDAPSEDDVDDEDDVWDNQGSSTSDAPSEVSDEATTVEQVLNEVTTVEQDLNDNNDSEDTETAGHLDVESQGDS